MENVINEIQFNNFDSFLNTISYGGEIHKTIYPNFIFRGESSDKFKLIPSVLREDNKNKVMMLGGCNGLDNQMMRIAAEYNIVRTLADNFSKYPDIRNLFRLSGRYRQGYMQKIDCLRDNQSTFLTLKSNTMKNSLQR